MDTEDKLQLLEKLEMLLLERDDIFSQLELYRELRLDTYDEYEFVEIDYMLSSFESALRKIEYRIFELECHFEQGETDGLLERQEYSADRFDSERIYEFCERYDFGF